MPDSFGNPLPGENITSSFMQPNQPGITIPSVDTNLTSGNTFGFDTNSDAFNSIIDNNVVSSLNAPTSPNGGGTSWFDGFFSNSQGGQGWGVPALQTATGVANTFLGFQQLNEGKRQNRIAQSQWQAQFDIQKGEYDRQVRERNARVAANRNNASNAAGG